MKSKSLAVQSIPEATEKRAKLCRFSVSPLLSAAWIEAPVRPANRRHVTSRTCLILVLFLGLPAALCAQKTKDAWSNLNLLKAGQGIEVIESNMKSHSGRFVTVTEESLSFQEKGSDVSMKRDNIARVSTGSGPRRGEHAVLGLVVGGAIGAGIGAAAGSAHGFLGGSSRGITALVGIAIGAPSGALLGAAMPAHTTVYRITPEKPHQTASP